MNIAVVGLGLIGGSLCKTIKRYTNHACFGIDTDMNTITSAIEAGAIDSMIPNEKLSQMDLSIIALHPRQTIEFILKNASLFQKGSLVIDTCGVKKEIVDKVTPVLEEQGVTFLGCHPMAGREFSGFQYAQDTLFDNASFIITPSVSTPFGVIDSMKKFALSLGFGKAVVATPEEHDQVIAFTSQLAHVVSNAYIKSPTLQKECGFSAGSFLDLTRVAKLNEEMWSALFMMNRHSLLFELDTILEKLEEYRQALLEKDEDKLRLLLREGRMLKEESLKKTSDKPK